ncbi:MAG TPA: XdhC family protein, partial [Syntrophales bacterium]|nr:XdhC family protein [Syntrophales bacterium]
MDIFLCINALLAEAQTFCLATVISSSDDSIASGIKAIIRPGGRLEGGTGQSETDSLLTGFALQILKDQKKQLIEVRKG